ncbi:hypothetical protein SLEP1_g35072 [Rubroshorea leprosula]|uniref:Uncharacterized protein n=1 Tax=Rubroshorea leprosula TaxID=152421 RepID=A0AAV5KM30_9ROSI|nr:hypothetical protein SLEP1_g35072 [Rubroshorea leprosula]
MASVITTHWQATEICQCIRPVAGVGICQCIRPVAGVISVNMSTCASVTPTSGDRKCYTPTSGDRKS